MLHSRQQGPADEAGPFVLRRLSAYFFSIVHKTAMEMVTTIRRTSQIGPPV